MKISKVILCVKNLEESIKFYQEAFGFELIRTAKIGIGESAFLRSDDLHMTLVTSPKLPVGIVALGTNMDDVEGALEELKSKGARVIMEPSQVGFGIIGKIWDPNDISINVISEDLSGEDSGVRVTHMPNRIK